MSKEYTAQEMREMAYAIVNECGDEENGLVYASRYFAGHVFYPDEASAMLRQAAEMRDRLDAMIKKHTVDKYAKCKKCKSAIDGKPRTFKGEPCYWHIDCGLDEHHFRAGDTEDRIVHILKYVIRGNARKGDR